MAMLGIISIVILLGLMFVIFDIKAHRAAKSKIFKDLKFIVIIGLLFLGLLFLKEKTTSKLDKLINQLETGKFKYARSNDGCLIDLRFSTDFREKAMMINPLKSCRESSLKAKFLVLPLSSCGGRCSARENAVSCLYDTRKELKGDQKVIAALKKVIMLEKSDYSGESVCKQRSMAIILLKEIGGSAEREYIKSFLKRESSGSGCQSLECNAAELILQ